MVFLITGIASTFCVPLYDKAKASKGARVGNRKSKGGKDDQKHERKKEKKRKAIKKGKKKKRGNNKDHKRKKGSQNSMIIQIRLSKTVPKL